MASAAYLRKSRSDDPNEPLEETLSRHKLQLQAAAHRYRLSIVRYYEEVVTGDSLYLRPQMMQLLEDVERGVYDSVLCVDIDRLGRGGMRDQGVILETFKYSGTRIVTLEKIYDLNDDLDEELTEFKTFLSRREYKMITKRLHRGILQTVKEGGHVSSIPYGYARDHIGKRPTLRIVEEEAFFVRMIYDLYVNQGIGCHAIAAQINALGAHPRRSDRFAAVSVRHILKNPVYAGKILYNRTTELHDRTCGNGRHIIVNRPEDDWIAVDGMHPPIIDEAVWQQAGRILRERWHPPCYTGVVRNPLAGICVCKKCGSKMVVQTSKGRWSYLKCPNRQCDCKSANLTYVEAELLGLLEDMLSGIQVQAPDGPAGSTEIVQALEQVRRSISNTERQRDRLCDLLEQGIYTPELFRQRSGAVNRKLASLHDVADSLEGQLAEARQNDPAQRIQIVQTALSLYFHADAAEKNRLLKSSLSRVLYCKDRQQGPREFTLEAQLK